MSFSKFIEAILLAAMLETFLKLCNHFIPFFSYGSEIIITASDVIIAVPQQFEIRDGNLR